MYVCMYVCMCIYIHIHIYIYIYENRILRRIFVPKRYENGEWRRLHYEELHNLYRYPNKVRVIKSRRLRCAGNGGR